MPGITDSIHVSTDMVIVVLSIMFSITFVLLFYVKFCRTIPFEVRNRQIHQHQNLCGVEKQVIESLPVFKFSSLKGSKQGLECVVCLSKFEDSETLRLLPKCKHAFHVNCIDMWLESHSTCPLCRYRVDPGDINNFATSISSNFLRVPSNLTDDPNLEIFVHREQQSPQASSRFNTNKDEEQVLVIDKGTTNWEDMHKFNHKILISAFVARRRWSDLNSSDLISLNSEMLGVLSSTRFFPSESTNSGDNYKRSVSEIANVPRFAEIKKLVASDDNNIIEREERLWKMWLPMACRTLQGLPRRQRSSRGFEHRRLASIV